MNTHTGFEVGRFRLKPAVSEEDLIAASRRMEDVHISRQDGFQGRHLIAVDGGVYLDIVFAASRDHAERICQSWMGQPECEAYLALIVPESIEFGRVL